LIDTQEVQVYVFRKHVSRISSVQLLHSFYICMYIYIYIGLAEKSFYKLVKRPFLINICVKNNQNLSLKKEILKLKISIFK